MIRTLGLCLLLAAQAASLAAQERAPVPLDQTDPAAVVEAIFEAAHTGDPSRLGDLCPPQGGNDGDTADICAMTVNHERWDGFVAWFATGELTGEVAIDGHRATVPFRFGPDGTETEEMRLVRIDGRWYLASF